MDDRIIDFNEIKKKVKEKDVDRLEDYMYSLYYDMVDGKITMAEFTKNIYKYMNDNNISQDKFLDIQKKLMERYGFDSSIIDKQLKDAGISISEIGNNYENIRKTMSFHEKYNNKVITKSVSIYSIKNDKNQLEIILEGTNIILESLGKIDLNDIELNDFLCSYKKVVDEKPLKISVCENVNKYEY